ncbi:hypothetical protein VP1G_06449 [Cytospora mali]|uniref:Uncharacterized protein n=1 Tax=Cytospora mali TaxID=578113 RepID=A0A194V5S6_CYTMA|nr:hypothetical protein VP1G_06449 [Valsa mali var. pyri (nom. inval.)]
MESVTSEAATATAPGPPARSSPPAGPVSPRAATTSFSLPSASGSASGPPPAPLGHAFRRSVTVDEASQFRRKPSLTSFPSSDYADSPSHRLQRRSSTLSDFSLSEARRNLRDSTDDIFNPSGAKDEMVHGNTGALAALPVAFALLPALFGVLFEGGNAITTDVMLLGLVFIFLRYTITQPWQWYHSAQDVRMRQEVGLDSVFEDESDTDAPPKRNASVVTLDDVPEETEQDDHETSQATHTESEPEKRGSRRHSTQSPSRTRSQEAALNELYIHEVLALISCFLSPVVGAYLLHAIRGQLSRPSEGLLTDFNITVFLLAAEIKPLSHALKLIQARTLHLQRIVQSTPIPRSTTTQLEEMHLRLAQLEYRAEATEEITAQALARETQQQQKSGSSGGKQEAAIVRDVRNAIQPELDALNRAVRRYEKKATVLALQTESRLGAVDTRLNDAISLAAAAAKQNNQTQWSFSALVGWVVDSLVLVVLIPYHAAMFVVVWPFRTVAGLWSRKSSRHESISSASGTARSSRGHGGKGSKNGSGSERDRFRDRVPSRLSRRYSP